MPGRLRHSCAPQAELLDMRHGTEARQGLVDKCSCIWLAAVAGEFAQTNAAEQARYCKAVCRDQQPLAVQRLPPVRPGRPLPGEERPIKSAGWVGPPPTPTSFPVARRRTVAPGLTSGFACPVPPAATDAWRSRSSDRTIDKKGAIAPRRPIARAGCGSRPHHQAPPPPLPIDFGRS